MTTSTNSMHSEHDAAADQPSAGNFKHYNQICLRWNLKDMLLTSFLVFYTKRMHIAQQAESILEVIKQILNTHIQREYQRFYLLFRPEHDGRDEAVIGCHGYGDVTRIELTNVSILPTRITFRHF